MINNDNNNKSDQLDPGAVQVSASNLRGKFPFFFGNISLNDFFFFFWKFFFFGGFKNQIGRAYFNVHGRPAHLSIDPVAASDEGDYRCRVDFRKARTINTVISLKVISMCQK